MPCWVWLCWALQSRGRWERRDKGVHQCYLLFVLHKNNKQVVHPKTDEQRYRLQERVQTCLLFKTLAESQLGDVIDAMFEHKIEAGEFIINQNDDGDYFYVVETGVYSALIQTEAGNLNTVFTFDNEGNFGELALLYQKPRPASVRVSTGEKERERERPNSNSDSLHFLVQAETVGPGQTDI